MSKVKLTKEAIDKIFEDAKNSNDYLVQLHAAVLPALAQAIKDQRRVQLTGYVKANEHLRTYICRKAMDFDREANRGRPYQEQYMIGGPWLNSGFSHNEGLNNWTVDVSGVEVLDAAD